MRGLAWRGGKRGVDAWLEAHGADTPMRGCANSVAPCFHILSNIFMFLIGCKLTLGDYAHLTMPVYPVHMPERSEGTFCSTYVDMALDREA
ncbi:hypothetical protein B0H14DRAFT_2437266 [Mycena olivaceomarginata]|nr:hypothetical protein B0H14DRAFT_2437266 [Mycena olivaceomarginata]